MQYRNNLTAEWGNAYFRVTASFDCYVHIGISDSNTYAGRSMLMGNVYRKLTLVPGDEIHDLFGGVFAVHAGNALRAQMQLPTKHPFERGPDVVGPWPLDKLQRIETGAAAVYTHKPEKMSPGTRCANGIDSVGP